MHAHVVRGMLWSGDRNENPKTRYDVIKGLNDYADPFSAHLVQEAGNTRQ